MSKRRKLKLALVLAGIGLVCVVTPGCAGLLDVIEDEADKYPECAARALQEFHSCAAEVEAAKADGLVDRP